MTSHTNTGVVLFKEPAMHHTVADHRLPKPKRLAGVGRLLLGVLVASIATALPTVPAHAATDQCPNAALRALNDSTGLPDCRAYEMVTPPFKQGFAPLKPNYGDDGAVAYYSTGSFDGNAYGGLGNQYVARRSATGWNSIAMNPPGEPWVFAPAPEGAREGMSSDFRSVLWWMRPRTEGPGERDVDHPERDGLYVRRPDGTFSLIAPNPGTANPRALGATPDLSHVIVGVDPGLGAGGERV